QLLEQELRLGVRERLELQGCSTPARAVLEQLRAGQAEEQDRRFPAPSRHVLEQVEEGRLRPVHVLEADDERLLTRERLEQAPDRPERLRARDGRRPRSDRAAYALEDQRPVRLGLDRGGQRVLTAGRAYELAQR